MNLDDGRVQREGFDADAHDLFQLQLLEDAIQHPVLRPAVHPDVDRMPVAEPTRKSAPLTALLGNIENRVEHLEIGQSYVAALHRQAVTDLFVLLWRDFHLPASYQVQMSLV